MGKILEFIILISLCVFSFSAHAMSDKEVKQKIIEQSIRNYSGNCPYPYNRDRAGRKCGKRSAHSRPGGASPVCYESDVTPSMIEEYRRNHGG